MIPYNVPLYRYILLSLLLLDLIAYEIGGNHFEAKNVNNIQLFPEGEVNSGGYIPRREASRYISTAFHRP